jgi:uncharacterized protein DUF4383
MIKKTATIGGIVLIGAGLLGFLAPGLMGMHLTAAHNLVHLVSGALALYFGLKGTVAGARTFCIAFGALYGLLGLVGFVAGGADHTLTLIPGQLVLGTMDHLVHLIVGAVFMVVAFAERRAAVMPPKPS